jgi:hypothetical protein
MASNRCRRQTRRPGELIEIVAAATGSSEGLRQCRPLGAQVLVRFAYQEGDTRNDGISQATRRALEAAFYPCQRAAALEATPGPRDLIGRVD